MCLEHEQDWNGRWRLGDQPDNEEVVPFLMASSEKVPLDLWLDSDLFHFDRDDYKKDGRLVKRVRLQLVARLGQGGNLDAGCYEMSRSNESAFEESFVWSDHWAEAHGFKSTKAAAYRIFLEGFLARAKDHFDEGQG